MKTIHLIIVILCSILAIKAQGQEPFQRSYGGLGSDYGRAVAVCSDGGYLLAGSTNSFADESTDMYFLKVDENGDFLWGEIIGSPGSIDWALDIEETIDQNFIVVGYTNDAPENNYQGVILKMSSTGEVIWQYQYGGAGWDFIEVMTLDAEGNIYAAGQKNDGNQAMGWIIKVSEDGDVLWERTYASSGNMKITGLDLCQTGDIAFSGYNYSFALAEHTQISGLVSADNETLWITSYPEFGDVKTGKCVCSNLGIIFTSGQFWNGLDWDTHLSRLERFSGFDLTSITFNHPNDGLFLGVDTSINGNVLVCGAIEGFGFSELDATSNMYDLMGVTLGTDFTQVLGGFGTDKLYDIQGTPDGGYVAIGETNSFGNGWQIHLVKVSADGDRDDENEDYLDTTTPVLYQSPLELVGVFPNPTSGFCRIQTHDLSRILETKVYNNTGELVMSIKTERPSVEMNISLEGLPNGVYFLLVETEKGFTQSKLVLIN